MGTDVPVKEGGKLVKKNKARKRVIFIAVMIFAVGIGIICILWMDTPGIHFLFGFMHADVRENCYLYNPKEDKFLGKTEVVIRGQENGITKKFNGEISVVSYEVKGETNIDFSTYREGAIWMMTYAGIAGTLRENEEGIESWKAKVDERMYTVYVNVKNSDDFVIEVGESEEPLYAVHAVSEQKAREVLKQIVLQGKGNVVWD